MIKRRILPILILIAALLGALTACSRRPVSNSYVVTFDDGSGQVNTLETDVEIKEEPEPKREGKILDGWYFDAEFTEKVDFPYTPQKNITLYAKYILIEEGNEELVFTLSEDGAEYSVTSYNGEAGRVVIPAEHNGLPVTELEVGFLKNSSCLKKLYFHSNLKIIAEHFFYCYNFSEFINYSEGGIYSVSDGVLYKGDALVCFPAAHRTGGALTVEYALPSFTRTIERNSFKNAVFLKKLVLNDGLTAIYEDFRTNAALEEFSIVGGVSYFSDKGVLYTADKKTLLSYPIACKSTEYALLEQTETVAAQAFEKSNIKTLDINKNLKILGDHAELNCLEKITVNQENTNFYDTDGVLFDRENRLIKYPVARDGSAYEAPEGTTELTSFSFCGISNLTELKLPASVIKLDAYVFGLTGSHSGLRSLSFDEGSELKTLEGTAFLGCEQAPKVLLSVRIPPVTDCELLLSSVKELKVPLNVLGLYEAVWGNYGQLLPADFSVPNYTVTFDSHGGTEYGERVCAFVKEVPIPVAEGKIFQGWFTEKDGCGEKIAFPYPVTGDITLHAYWTEE